MRWPRVGARIAAPLACAALLTGAVGAVNASAAPASSSGGQRTHSTKPAPAFVTGQEDPAQEVAERTQRPNTALTPPLSADRHRLRARADQTRPTTLSRPSMKSQPKTAQRQSSTAAVAACSPSDFASRTGSALVTQVKSSTTDCINSLFSVSGSTARSIFNESQMVTIAYALRDVSASYPGDASTGAPQLVLFLRAGYYVQYYDPTTVGTYGTSLKTAIEAGLDRFFASAHSQDVTDANGETLSEAVTLIDSAEENARYLYVVKRLLNGYNSSYDSSWWMLNAVNNTYTVLFRGHQVPAFVSAVQSDPSVLDTLYNFASQHLNLLGGNQSYLTSNAGRELGRFLQHSAMQPTVRPKVAGLLNQSQMTGPTAPLWVGSAEMTDQYDQANCSYYNTCNLSSRLASSVLTSNYTCSSSIRILAQDMTASQLSSSCSSLLNQDAYFHSIVKDSGPVANDYNSTIEVVVFNSSTDYQTYAGAMYGIDTNNGGMYLEGDPAASGNQPRFIAYEAEWVRPTFQIWNLNHEYTHYLDGRYDMYGDFNAGVTTPTIWWIEGFAEYVSYSYRNVAYTDAMTQAGYQTYTLRQLFDTDYTADQTRIYNWGYLASRFMITQHWADTAKVLGYYRTGQWNAARTYLTSTIGTRYDAEFRTWLQGCAAGSCGGSTTPTNQAPTASFSVSANGLTASFTDSSSDADGTIASRKWSFGDGSTSTATNPTKTYAAAGTYTVQLTVTDDGGKTASTSRSVTVSSGGGTPATECTGSDVRALGQNCVRSNRSAAAGDDDYLYLYVPAGTAKLTITSSGGTGNADLYYSPSSWATPSNYTLSSTNAGNSETITVNNPPSGYVYITLHATTSFSGVSVKTSF